MQKLKDSIVGKNRWNGLTSYITLVEENREADPNASLDGAKSILESISKTILEDKGIVYASDSNFQFLVKKAFESLPVFSKLSVKDSVRAKSILGSLENIGKSIAEFRNDHGFFSHGRDLESEKFDRYLVEMAIASSDLLASFLIISHAEDLKDRNRVYYEENDEFNRFIDDTCEEYPVVRNIQLSPSKTLYTDTVAYKEELLEFISKKDVLITKLEISQYFVSTRAIASDLIDVQSYLTDNEIKRIVYAGINNPQVYHILGHGYTKRLFTWILDEKSEILTSREIDELKLAFAKKMY